jgi:hypothetical protein
MGVLPFVESLGFPIDLKRVHSVDSQMVLLRFVRNLDSEMDLKEVPPRALSMDLCKDEQMESLWDLI